GDARPSPPDGAGGDGGHEKGEPEDRQAECGDEHRCLLELGVASTTGTRATSLCAMGHDLLRIYVDPRTLGRGGGRGVHITGSVGAGTAVLVGVLVRRGADLAGRGRSGRAGLAQLGELVLQVAGESAAVVLLEGP